MKNKEEKIKNEELKMKNEDLVLSWLHWARRSVSKRRWNIIFSSFFIGLIFYAADREAVYSVEVVHVGIAIVEVEEASISTTNRTAPIVADGPDIEEQTIDVVAVTRHGQFKRRCKSACACVSTPT